MAMLPLSGPEGEGEVGCLPLSHASDLGAPEVSCGSMRGAGGTKHCHFLVNQQLKTLMEPQCLSPGWWLKVELWAYCLEYPGTEQR